MSKIKTKLKNSIILLSIFYLLTISKAKRKRKTEKENKS